MITHAHTQDSSLDLPITHTHTHIHLYTSVCGHGRSKASFRKMRLWTIMHLWETMWVNENYIEMIIIRHYHVKYIFQEQVSDQQKIFTGAPWAGIR